MWRLRSTAAAFSVRRPCRITAIADAEATPLRLETVDPECSLSVRGLLMERT